MRTTNVVAPNLIFPSLMIAAGRGRTECEKKFLSLPHQARGWPKEQGRIRALRSILSELYSEGNWCSTGVGVYEGSSSSQLGSLGTLTYYVRLRTLTGCTESEGVLVWVMNHLFPHRSHYVGKHAALVCHRTLKRLEYSSDWMTYANLFQTNTSGRARNRFLMLITTKYVNPRD